MRSRLLGPSALVAVAVALMHLAGCEVGRYPVCQTNADCAAWDAGKLGNVCFNLRCVECQYDTDCPTGKVCGAGNTCQGLGTPGPASTEDGPKMWDPKDWNECAKTCKDPECLKICDQRFKK